ncbi:uncharacterized protein METZ01_LOCUS331697 [marine metagenome]|uniref:Uncharacterized protein n=1 Tax=marine metagenome TaxID=408172 RepID=A0A382PZQ9_9ZZZZ
MPDLIQLSWEPGGHHNTLHKRWKPEAVQK